VAEHITSDGGAGVSCRRRRPWY